MQNKFCYNLLASFLKDFPSYGLTMHKLSYYVIMLFNYVVCCLTQHKSNPKILCSIPSKYRTVHKLDYVDDVNYFFVAKLPLGLYLDIDLN